MIAEGNLDQLRQSKMPKKDILALRRKLPSEKIRIRFSRQCLDRANSERISTEWIEEQEEFAKRKADNLHKELSKRDTTKLSTMQTSPFFCSHKGEDYRQLLDYTHQRKDVHRRQWRSVTYDGLAIIFGTVGGKVGSRAIDGKTAQRARLFLFVAVKRNSQVLQRYKSNRMQHR